MVGDTGFEPVTSSVSTSFTPSAGVRRGPSEHEPLPHRPPTCAHIRTRCHSLSHSPHFLVSSPELAHSTRTAHRSIGARPGVEGAHFVDDRDQSAPVSREPSSPTAGMVEASSYNDDDLRGDGLDSSSLRWRTRQSRKTAESRRSSPKTSGTPSRPVATASGSVPVPTAERSRSASGSSSGSWRPSRSRPVAT